MTYFVHGCDITPMDNYDTPRTPRRKKVIDRFIPHREGVNLGAAFSVASTIRSPERPKNREKIDPTDVRAKETQEARDVYYNLLKSEMFGSDISPRPHGSTSSLLLANSLGATVSTGNTTLTANLGGTNGANLSPTHSMSSVNSCSSLSLPTSPRKPKPQTTNNNNVFRYSPQKMIRSDSDLSDMSMGGGVVNAGGVGLGSNLRPESRDYLLQPKPRKRVFKQTPGKTLDAPGLTGDYYLNVLEWGPNSMVAVGLYNYVYVWDHDTGKTAAVAKLGNDVVTSVSWMNSGEHLAVGTASGKVQIYDVVTCQRLRNMDGHTKRASSLSWNDHILSSGSQDTTILHRDCRIKQHYVKRLESHYGEVCGLKWNTDLQQLASGGNDNKLKIWSGVNSATSSDPLYEYEEHTSAVKGLAWSPHQRGLLASGGGYCDRSIWFWNTLTGKAVNSIDTGSQVCNLAWNPRVRELVSAQGNMYNDVIVWKYSTMQPLTRLRAHASRVLHLSMSPQGDTLVTGAGDETLRLWSMFDDDNDDKRGSLLSSYGQLR